MKLSDVQIGFFISKALHLGKGKRDEFLGQANRLIEKLESKIRNESSFKVRGFKKTGSLAKGTVLKPSGDFGVDADIAVFLDVAEARKGDINQLHQVIRQLLIATYPSKATDDFKVQPRTLGIHFRESGLDVDLVPVIPIVTEPGYGWQPSSIAGEPVKTSIQGQLDFIQARRNQDPRFRDLVRLIKKWRNVNEVDRLRSFAIELIVSHLQDTNGPAPSLESGLLRFFLYVAQSELKEPITFRESGNIVSYPGDPVVIIDPVNRENNVTSRLSELERKEIVASAENAWATIESASWKGGKGETLDLWKEVMGRSFTIEED